ncbi:MAG: hypothetical protein ACK5EA_27895, partial [Planctomycetaceae bacterium]
MAGFGDDLHVDQFPAVVVEAADHFVDQLADDFPLAAVLVALHGFQGRLIGGGQSFRFFQNFVLLLDQRVQLAFQLLDLDFDDAHFGVGPFSCHLGFERLV